ncbi:MAG: DUF805 domain-containing protein [Actinomycetota bacterium]
MKAITDLFLSFDGRIGRAKFWLGMLVLAALSFVLVQAIIELVRVSDVALKYAALTATLLLFPTYAVCAKRFHDRGRPGWLALLCILPSYLASMLQGIGIADADNPTPIFVLLNFAVIGAGLWLLVDLGLLRGTQGPNRYGPDAFGRPHADAGLA